MTRSRSGESDEVDRVPLLTAEGIDRLRQELEHLRLHQRPRAAAWLSEVLGDWSDDEDSTESDSAQSEFWFVEGRIQRIEQILSAAKVLEQPQDSGAVQLGSRVTVVEGEQEPESYRIVDPAEADPAHGFISYESPLGRVLIGRHRGETVTVQAPDGPIVFQLVAVD
jgi:transcription elongation factor GreA